MRATKTSFLPTLQARLAVAAPAISFSSRLAALGCFVFDWLRCSEIPVLGESSYFVLFFRRKPGDSRKCSFESLDIQMGVALVDVRIVPDMLLPQFLRHTGVRHHRN